MSAIAAPTTGFLSSYRVGLGYPELFLPPAPGAGTAYKRTVPGETAERVMVVQVTYTASAAVANRTPFFAIQNGDGVEILRFGATTKLVASAAQRFTWSTRLGAGYVDGNGDEYVGLPELIFMPGFTRVISADNIDVADTITGVAIYIERFPTGPLGYDVPDTLRAFAQIGR